MFIARDCDRATGRIVYKVLRSYRKDGKVQKENIVYPGKYPAVEEAYQAKMANYLRASEKLERLEYAMESHKGEKGIKWLEIGLRTHLKQKNIKAIKDIGIVVVVVIELTDANCHMILARK